MRPSLLLTIIFLALAACSGNPSPTPAPQVASPTATFAPTDEPISALGRRGSLYFTQGENGLWLLDLATGEESEVWVPPEGGIVEGVAVSAEEGRVAIAYSPPPAEGESPVPRPSLYLMDADTMRPEPLLQRQGENEALFQPTWSAEGEWLYFTRSGVEEREDGPDKVILNIERVSVEGRAPEVVIENAENFSVSMDGNRVAYLAFNPESYARMLMAASADGSDARQVLSGTDYPSVAAPRISPDGSQIAFSSPSAGQQDSSILGSTSMLSGLFGADVALAHGLPSDIFTVGIEGGEPTRRSFWGTDAPVAAWSPAGDHLAVLRPGGIFLLREQVPRFLVQADGHGDLAWAP